MDGVGAQIQHRRVDDSKGKVVETEDEPEDDKGEKATDPKYFGDLEGPLVLELQLDDALAAFHDDITDIV